MPMGPPGRDFPSHNSNNGWSQQQQQPTLPHHIPPQVPQFSQYHHQTQQQQQQARLRHQPLPGPNIPNPVPAIQHVKAGLQQRQPMSQNSNYPIPKLTVAKKVKNPTMDKEKIQTWHEYPIEKKPLRKHKFSADVFPQDPQQEEDKMTPDRIKRGFHLSNSIIRDESESGMKHFSRDDKAATEDIDEFLNKAAVYIQTVSQKKAESLDKKKLKEISFVPFKDRQKLTQWLNDLAKSTSYHALAKKIPKLKSEECLEELFEHKIPIPHAVWFLKICHVGIQTELQQKLQQTQTSKIKKPMELIDYTLVFIKLIKELLDKIDDESTATLAKQKWKYYSMLIRHSVMEGLVNRQDFFIELADVLAEMNQKCSLEKMQLYRIIISFVSLFIRDIIKNVFIARKFLYYVGLRLRGYMEEYEKKKKVRIPSKQVFSELLSCNNHRLIVLTSFGIITSIIIDCPEACIWMPLDESQFPPYIVGSPLDILPVDPLTFPNFLNEKDASEFTKSFKKILASKLKKIHERSCEIDNRWALNCSRETGFPSIVRACLDVVSLLDLAELTKPRVMFDLYAKVFGLTKGNDIFDGEIVIRVKAMLQWAITSEREGTYRALLVSKILRIYGRHFRSLTFNSRTLVQVIVDFLNREAPTPGKPGFRKEYSNLILLLIEFQRANLFSHDDYIMLLMKYDELKDNDPIIPRLQQIIDASKKSNSDSTMVEDPDEIERPVINFIPTPTVQEKNKQGANNLGDHEFCRLKEEIDDDIAFMEKPDEMTTHERLIIQLPIEQSEANRGAVNQRAIYLYGISSERDEVAKNLKLFGTNVINKWMDNVLRFRRSNKTVRRRSDIVALDQIFSDFKKLTYYDRLCVTGYCMDGYLQILRDFIQGTCHSLPNIECFDMLLSMAEASQGIGWIMGFFLECFTVLTSCEKILDSIRTDIYPGTFATQQCFAIVGFLSEHYKYFLLSKEAIKICNGLYRMIEKSMKAEDYPTTCWVKAIAAFLIQARYDLRIRGRSSFAFRARDCRKLLPQHGTQIDYVTGFDEDIFISEDELTNQKIYSFHDLKKFAQKLSNNENEHSFVVNAFALAREFRNDFAKLSELANYCGNISAIKPLESHWLNVIEALCTPHGRKRNFLGFDKIDNSMDYKDHYTYATFVTLLATRFCFSVHSLFVRFNNDCFKSLHVYEGYAESSHFLLMLQIVANISTATDEPFYLSKSLFHLSDIPFRFKWRSYDLRCLRILQIRELDADILPLLLNIFNFYESIRKKDHLSDVRSFAWNTVRTITDQEWIISKMFQICSIEKDMEDFIKDGGKLLLVIALRRKSEENFIKEMMKEKYNTKGLMKRLFPNLTIWNLRATLCDIKVLIRESYPSNKTNGNKNAQSQLQAMAVYLINDIGTSCQYFFLTDDLEKIRQLKAPTVQSFTFSDLNCYWLLSELIEVIPIPDNVQRTIKDSFLDEVYKIFQSPLETEKENERIRKLKINANLLETQPFLNLISTCQQGEDLTRDKLIKVMLDYAADMKLPENPAKLFEKRFEVDRAGIFLRMNLVGTMIDFINTPPANLASFAVCIFQAMINGVITPERDGEYFTTCYDLMLTLVLSLFTGSGQHQYDKDGNIKKLRYFDYASFVKLARAKLADKPLTGNLQFLELLFPIPAPTSEQPTFNDTFPVNSPMKNIAGKLQNIGPPGFARNLKHIKLDKYCEPAQKRLQRFIYHNHQNDFFHPGTIGNPLLKGMLEQFVVGPPTYAEPTAEDRQRQIPPISQQNSMMNLRHPQPNFHGGQPQHPHPQQNPHFFHHQERPQISQPGGPPMQRLPTGPQQNMQMASTSSSSMGMTPHQPNYNPMSQPPPSQQMMPPQPMMANNNPNGQMFNQIPPMHPPAGFGMPQQQPLNPRMQHSQPEQMRPPINAAPIRAVRKRNPSGGAAASQPGPKRPRNVTSMMAMNRAPMPSGVSNPNQMPPSYFMHQQTQQQGSSQQMWDQQPNQRQPPGIPPGIMQPPPQQQQLPPPQQHQPQPQPPMNFNSNAANRFGGVLPISSSQGRMQSNQGHAPQTDDSDTKERLKATIQSKIALQERQAMQQIPPQMNQPQNQQFRQQHFQPQQQQAQMRHPSQQQPQQQQQSQMQMPPQQQNFNPQMRM